MSNTEKDDLLSDYDLGRLKNGVRGKYLSSHAASANVVVIEPDLAEAFPDSRSVNDALRELIVRRERGSP